jgi:hypothetical protein
LIIRLSGIVSMSENEAGQAKRDLKYVVRVLNEMAEFWPVASHTARSLRLMEDEYCPA